MASVFLLCGAVSVTCSGVSLVYLQCALPDRIDELLDDQVNAFEARLLQLDQLLFHDGLEGHVRGEQPRPEVTHTHTQGQTQ